MHPGKRPEGSRRRSRLEWLLVPCGLVLGIAITLAALQVQRDAARDAEALGWAEELNATAETLDDQGDDMWTRESLTDDASAEADELRGELHELLGELDGSGTAERQLAAVRPNLASYEAVFDAHLEWVAETDPSEVDGERHFDATVDPRFKDLIGSVTQLIDHLERQTTSSRRLADRFVFAFAPITVLVLLLALALGRAERFRHRAAIHELETRHNARFGSLVRNAADLICVTDSGGGCTYATPSATALLGVPPEVLTGRNLAEFADADAVAASIAGARPAGPAEVALEVRHADGGHRQLTGTCLDLSHDPSVGGFVWNLRDVTAQHQLAARLAYQAHHDTLTGMANRALFHERAEDALRASRAGGRPLSLMVLDVDQFKAINDSLGHAAGDDVLVTIAARCRTCVRAGDTVARFGGDEFAFLLPDTDAGTAEAIARRLCELLEQPQVTQGTQVMATASIGIAVGGPTSSGVDELLRFADAAMYAAKTAGRAGYRVFDAVHAEESAS